MATSQGNNGSKTAFWIFTVVVLLAATVLLWRFIPAILWATVLSVLLYPWYNRVLKRYEGKKNPEAKASLFVTLFTAFVVIVPFLGLSFVGGAEVYNFASELVADSPDRQINFTNIANEVDVYIQPTLERVGVRDFSLAKYIADHKSEIASNVYGPVTRGLKRIGMMLVTLVIAFLTTYFFLRDGHKMLGPTLDLVPLPRDKTHQILKNMAATIRTVFLSFVVVGLIQGLLSLVIYLSLGVPSPYAWFIVTTILAMIPLLGAPVGYVPAGLLMILTGHTLQGVLVIALGFGLVSTIDNYLRPKFISMGSSMHMMAVFFSLLGGVFTMGPIGLVAGPMLLTLVLGVFDVLRESRKLSEANGASLTP